MFVISNSRYLNLLPLLYCKKSRALFPVVLCLKCVDTTPPYPCPVPPASFHSASPAFPLLPQATLRPHSYCMEGRQVPKIQCKNLWLGRHWSLSPFRGNIQVFGINWCYLYDFGGALAKKNSFCSFCFEVTI